MSWLDEALAYVEDLSDPQGGDTSTVAADTAACFDCSPYNERKFKEGTIEVADYHSCVAACCRAGNPTAWIPSGSCGPATIIDDSDGYMGSPGGHGFDLSDAFTAGSIFVEAFLTHGASLEPYAEDAAGGKDSGY